VVTTQRDRQAQAAPDLVKRQFKATGINQLWVGWAFGERMTSDLVISALNMALYRRRPGSVIHRSDQGSRYTSLAFGKRCKEMGVRPSMGTVGDAYDNAMTESLFATLECELINRRS